MASSGYFAPERPGETFQSAILPTRELPPPLPEVDRGRGSGQRAPSSGRGSRRARKDRPLGVLHRRHICCSQKGGQGWERPSGAKVARSWRFQTALLFLSPSTQRVLAHTKSPLLKRLWQAAF